MNIPPMSMHSIVYDIDPSLSSEENTKNIVTKMKLYPNPAKHEIIISFGFIGNY